MTSNVRATKMELDALIVKMVIKLSLINSASTNANKNDTLKILLFYEML